MEFVQKSASVCIVQLHNYILRLASIYVTFLLCTFNGQQVQKDVRFRFMEDRIDGAQQEGIVGV